MMNFVVIFTYVYFSLASKFLSDYEFDFFKQ